MSYHVTYFKFKDLRTNTHAQMKENAQWVDPPKESIQHRFFDYEEDAKNFMKRIFEDGYHCKVINEYLR